MKHILGIDVGTSNIKAVLFRETGEEIFSASQENEVVYQGNTAEQDMNAVWEKVQYCMKAVAKEAQIQKYTIAAIGVTGQGEGCWLIDKHGDPVQNAILWCDGRAVEEVAQLTVSQPELGKLYHKTTGSPPLTGSSMMLLKWMQTHREDLLKKASLAVNCKDWIRFKLTGIAGSEITDSFMSLLDVNSNGVAYELMNALGLGPYKKLIPAPRWSEDIVASLSDILADDWGLPRGIPVVAGAVDTSATAVGLGASHKNDVCVILGTTCACEIVQEKDGCNFGVDGTRYEKHPQKELYIELQPTMNGTPNIDWMVANIARTESFKELDAMVQEVPVGCNGVIYHPYISTAGERAPFYHPCATAGFFGIRQAVTRECLIRAVYEGISLSIRDCLQNVDKDSGVIYLAGGGAKSPVWAQMIADVTDMRVIVSKGKEFGAKGAAMIAGIALGIYCDYEDAARKTCSYEQIYDPNARNTKKYDLLYDLYKEIRMKHMHLWDRHNAVYEEINGIAE